IASPVTVNSGGTLAGTGTVGSVTVNSGGTLSPGTSPGILTTDDLTLNDGSTLTIELNGPPVGTQYAQVNVTGTVTVLSATLHVVLGFTPSAGQVFTIINNDSTDPVVGAFAGLAEGAILSVGGALFTLSYEGGDGNDVTLTALTPFAPTTFTVQQLAITLRTFRFRSDAVTLQPRLIAGAGRDGLMPWTDTVHLTPTSAAGGAFNTTIPAGAFTLNRLGQFAFMGTINGVQLNATLTPLNCPVFTPLGCREFAF